MRGCEEFSNQNAWCLWSYKHFFSWGNQLTAVLLILVRGLSHTLHYSDFVPLSLHTNLFITILHSDAVSSTVASQQGGYGFESGQESSFSFSP